MSSSCCASCILCGYISYVSFFCCLIIKDLTKEMHIVWKTRNVNTRGFNNYEIIPKIDENIISAHQSDTSVESEESATINLNNNVETILRKWTIRPNLSESINEDYPI